MKKKGLYRKLSMSELKNIFGGEMLDDQGRKIVRKNLDGVYSIKGGIVVKVYYAKDSNEKGYGNYILVKDQKNGVIVRYAHLDKINVKKGQMVNKEDEIGIMGNSGTDKKHLHVSVYKDSKRNDPMEYAASDLTMDKGREVNPLEYIRDKGVWPTNTRISGGFNEPYDFSLINSWYTHEGVDFSGRTNPKDPHNRLITDYQCGLKGDGSYNSYEDHKDSYELYIRTRDHQNKTMNILREEWINLGGKENLKKTLDGVDEKIKGIEDNITKSKNKLSEIEDSITKTEDILVPSFIKKKILTNLQKELNKAKKELDDLEDLLKSEKKGKEDFKTFAGQLERAGSVEFAKKIDKLNDAKAYRDKLKDEFEKAVKENEEVQKNSAFSNDYKAKYADYVNNIKAALEKAETNTNIIESNLTKYITGKKEEELLLVSEPKKPDLPESTNTATGQTSQTSSSTTTDTNTGNNNSDSSSEKDTDPEPWLSNPKPTKKNDKKNDGGNNPPPPKNNPPPKKGGGGGGSKPEPPSPPGGGGGSRTIYTPSSIDTNNEYYLGSLYGTKPFSAQESSAFNSTIISNELSALQPITSLNVAGLPVNDTAIKEDPFGV
ncbi:M23 family metallopeptidase [Treponema denticola]|uniref:M23 family metallopeptidase n=1 Tax=Treponema denticola TaxID=158 RepID=UPI0020A39DE2|nr:peptidoglycan DD-metalloendopeptidase family protein [Treponema denticola]UTC88699.1 peptidoglycan DD-metalloendopeptidase family protein [Treponema denticola]